MDRRARDRSAPGERHPSRAVRLLKKRPRRRSSRVTTIPSKAWLAEIATSLPQLPSLRAATRGASNMTKALASKAEENAPRKSTGQSAHNGPLLADTRFEYLAQSLGASTRDLPVGVCRARESGVASVHEVAVPIPGGLFLEPGPVRFGRIPHEISRADRRVRRDDRRLCACRGHAFDAAS